MQRTGFMSDIIRGLPASAIGGTKSTTEVGPASIYQPSGLSQIAGAYGVYKGLTDHARGGAVRMMEGGYIDNATGQYIEDQTAPSVDYPGHFGGMNDYAMGGLARYARGGKLRQRMGVLSMR